MAASEPVKEVRNDPMDYLFICRDGLASSLLSNLMWAMEARKAGREAAVLFTGEALAALSRGTFLWPRELQEQEARLHMADSAPAAGIPTIGRGEWRQLDIWKFLEKVRESQVPMFACPLWTGLLGPPPPWLKPLDSASVLKLLAEARSIVGSF